MLKALNRKSKKDKESPDIPNEYFKGRVGDWGEESEGRRKGRDGEDETSVDSLGDLMTLVFLKVKG